MKVVENSREQGQTNPPKPSFVYYKYILPVCTSVYRLLVSMFVVVCLFSGFLVFFLTRLRFPFQFHNRSGFPYFAFWLCAFISVDHVHTFYLLHRLVYYLFSIYFCSVKHFCHCLEKSFVTGWTCCCVHDTLEIWKSWCAWKHRKLDADQSSTTVSLHMSIIIWTWVKRY